MSDLRTGKLVVRLVQKGKKNQLVVPVAHENDLRPVRQEQLSAELDAEPIDKLDGREVEFEVEKNQVVRVREKGKPWQTPRPQQAAFAGGRGNEGRRQQGGRGGARHGRQGGRGQAGQQQRGRERQGRRPENLAPAFHNPYNFVPALPRDHLPQYNPVQGLPPGGLGDEPPIGHECYHTGRISGVISVKLTVETPLLIPDAAAFTENAHGHKTFPVRLGPDGRPYLAPTSVKGMLRAAYEAVTNSRMGVFADHENRLALRMPAADGLSLVPARIENNEIMLYLGTTRGLPTWNNQIRRWSVPEDLSYAAWLPRYRGKSLEFVEGGKPQHGEHVWCWLEKFQHWRWDKNGNTHKKDFKYWKVVAISRSRNALGEQPDPSGAPRKNGRSFHEPVGEAMIRVSGYACITNRNIKNKHDERVFFVHNQQPKCIPLTAPLAQAWKELILNYQATHEKDLETRRRKGYRPDQYLGDDPGSTAWSRHVYEKSSARLADHATCCYAFAEKESSDIAVRALYPVMISRKLHETSPLQLLPERDGLRPACSRDALSPADRVFGWVSQDGLGAYRGNLRVGPVTCRTADAVVPFGESGLPLAILGQPKPQQARFYVAASSKNGEAQQVGLCKEDAGYREGKGLRGRKVYPHHANLPASYWENPLDDRTQQAAKGRRNQYPFHQEYRRSHKPTKHPVTDSRGRQREELVMNEDGSFQLLEGDDHEQRDEQNRSIKGWVRPSSEFTFDLHVTNLSPVELGALLWLLSLNEDLDQPTFFHRLGDGKPLGFGSVTLKITSHDLRDGAAWRDYYRALPEPAAPHFDVSSTITVFKQAVLDTYPSQTAGGDLEARLTQLPFIAAFLRAATGFEDGKPVHYPRARQRGQSGPVPPHPEGRAFQWFVANDRTGKDAGPGLSLKDLVEDDGLPILEHRDLRRGPT